jgi:hypothetical protein
MTTTEAGAETAPSETTGETVSETTGTAAGETAHTPHATHGYHKQKDEHL